MWYIQWEKKAVQQIKKIPKESRLKIITAIQSLKQWPDCHNVKALTNYEYGYRLRVGRYRVFFDVEDTLKILNIEEVKKRNERTY